MARPPIAPAVNGPDIRPRRRARRAMLRPRTTQGPFRGTAGFLAAAGLAAAAVAASDRGPRWVFPGLPVGARAFAPPPVYARWWAEAERCAGRAGDLALLRWYVVPGVARFKTAKEGQVSAYYHAAARRIVIAEEKRLAASVVRHEMLHALLGPRSGHPHELFLGRCAGVVTCHDACRADTNRGWMPNASWLA